MNKSSRARKTAVLTLVLASVLFTAGAGQAVAMERASEADFGAHLIVDLLDRIGGFVSELAVEVIDILTKEGAEPTADG